MDDFATGPNDFHIYFVSNDKACVAKQNGGYVYALKKPLDFPNEWEVGVKQIILRSPFTHNNNVSYTSPDKPDDKGFTKSFSFLSNWIPENPKDLINGVNSSIPESLKNDFSISIDDENYAVLNVQNTQVKFNSDYLTDALGFKPNTLYPEQFPTKVNRVKSLKTISLANPIFYIETDFTVPELYGSYNRPIVCADMFQSSNSLVIYKYEHVSYYRVLRSYISYIFISVKDINNNYYNLSDPLIIKLHFRRSSIL